MEILLKNHIDVFILLVMVKFISFLPPFSSLPLYSIKANIINIMGINLYVKGRIFVFMGDNIAQFKIAPPPTAPPPSINVAHDVLLLLSVVVFKGKERLSAKTVLIKNRIVYIDVSSVPPTNKKMKAKFIWLNNINSKIWSFE